MDLPDHEVAVRRTDLRDARLQSALRGLACDLKEVTIYYGEWAARVRAADKPQAS